MPFSPNSSMRHVDRTLTDLSIAHTQSVEDSIFENVAPVVSVKRSSDKYTIFDQGEWNRIQMQPRAPGAPVQMGGFTVSHDTYSAKIYSGGNQDPREDQADADEIHDPEIERTLWTTGQALLKAEKLLGDAFMAQSVWTTDISGTTGTPVAGTSILQWDQAGSDPITDMIYLVSLVKKRSALSLVSGKVKVVLGFSVWSRLLNHAAITDRTKYTSADSITKDMLARLFQADQVLVPGLIYNSAAKGQTATNAYIVDPLSVGIFFVPDAPGKRTLSACYVFGVDGVDGFVKGRRVKSWYSDEMGINSDFTVAELYIDPKVTAASAGAFIYQAVAA